MTLPDGLPELTLGWGMLAWYHKYLRHPNGPRAGQRWKSTREQARFTLWWYAVDADGGWLFYHGARRLSKGSGKSPWASAYALGEFCGPSRVRDLDPRVLGGVVGRRVAMPWFQIAGPSLKATENTMRNVRAMAPKGSRLVADYGLDPGRQRYNMEPEGALEVITSSAATAEGAEATGLIGDETEHWTPGNGGVELANTLIDNATKSGARMIETANAWKTDVASVAEDTYEAWLAQELGRNAKNRRRILYDARMAPPDTDLADGESLRSALGFVYQDCPWADVDAIMTRIWSPKSSPDDSRRKYLNWPTSAEGAWVAVQDWQVLAKPGVTVAPEEPVVLFFDGSKSNDHSALIGCRVADGHVFTLGVWKPQGRHGMADEQQLVDVEEIDAAVAKAFDDHDVVAFFSDVREFESFAKITWREAYGDRVTMWAVKGGRSPEPIAWDMRSHTYDFETACELVEAEILDRAFTHDGNPDLQQHVANARRKHGRWGVTVRKETPKSPDKIDACVAMIGARMVRRRYLSEGHEPDRPAEAFFL